MKLTPDSKFMLLCAKFVNLVQINLLWLLCSLPVVTCGAATCAMLSCLYAMKKEEDAGFRAFFRSFSHHFRKATVLWLLMVFFALMLALDYRLVAYMTFPGRMGVIGLICFCGLGLILVSGLVFPLLVRFPGSLKDTVVNAVLLSLANLPKALLITAMNLLPLLLLVVLPQVFVFFSFLLPVCGCSLIALYDLNVAEKIFANLEERKAEE